MTKSRDWLFDVCFFTNPVSVSDACFRGGPFCWRKCVNYRPQRSWGKVMFSHVSVILFTRGVSTTLPPGQTPPRQTPPWADTPPEQTPCSACWDMVNKRAVRILLECNLVDSNLARDFKVN